MAVKDHDQEFIIEEDDFENELEAQATTAYHELWNKIVNEVSRNKTDIAIFLRQVKFCIESDLENQLKD